MTISENVPLHDKNWFKTGGPARFYCKPKTIDNFKEGLSFAHDKKLPLFVLGKGANILISDDGFDGLVIHPQLHEMRVLSCKNNDVLVQAQASASIDELIEFCLDNNAVGLEKFSCIPGTVGGSVFINIHYFEFHLSDFLVKGTVIDKETGEVKTVPASWFEFGYDDSTLRRNHNYLLTDATFKLQKSSETETAFARGRREEIIRHRVRRYPSTHTCGCFFRNLHKEELNMLHDAENKIEFVAHYLEKVGVKGELTCGNARVSEKHANMIVTSDNATSSDIIACAREMQERVYKTFGIMPQPECQLIGFKKYPLLK